MRFPWETHTHKRKTQARNNIGTVSSKLCQPFWVNLWRKQTYCDVLHLQVMHEVTDNSTVFSTQIRMRLFLLLNKQELMITSNITGSISAVISMRSWVTEYLSMNKCYESLPTLNLHSSFLIMRLLPHLLISIFSIFFLLYAFTSSHVCVPQLCMKWMWGLLGIKHLQIHYLLMDVLHGKLKAWENAQPVEQHQACNTSYTEKTIFWAYSKPSMSCGSHLRFFLYKEGNKLLWPIIYYKDL